MSVVPQKKRLNVGKLSIIVDLILIMTNQSWEPQTAEEILDNIKNEIERLSKLRMHYPLRKEIKHKGFKND